MKQNERVITIKDYITSQGQHLSLWDDESWLEHKKDAQKTVARAAEFLSRIGYKKPAIVSSGFRTNSLNKAIGGSPNSKHCFCQAIDLSDPSLKIGLAAEKNVELLAELGLWMESLLTTHKEPSRAWVHFQIIAPKSGNRIFLP